MGQEYQREIVFCPDISIHPSIHPSCMVPVLAGCVPSLTGFISSVEGFLSVEEMEKEGRGGGF
jgi:hypothetical protein